MGVSLATTSIRHHLAVEVLEGHLDVAQCTATETPLEQIVQPEFVAIQVTALHQLEVMVEAQYLTGIVDPDQQGATRTVRKARDASCDGKFEAWGLVAGVDVVAGAALELDARAFATREQLSGGYLLATGPQTSVAPLSEQDEPCGTQHRSEQRRSLPDEPAVGERTDRCPDGAGPEEFREDRRAAGQILSPGQNDPGQRTDQRAEEEETKNHHYTDLTAGSGGRRPDVDIGVRASSPADLKATATR